MGLRLNYDIDTTIQNTNELYVKISNIQYNLETKTVSVALTYWVSKKLKDRYENNRYNAIKFAEVPNTFILYKDDKDSGSELSLPTLLNFVAEDLTNTELMKWCYEKVKKYLESRIGKYISDI